MENKQMADYTLTIKADSGYESTTEGRCTAEQYGQAIAALHGEAPQRKPLTDEMVVAAARELNKRAAEACNVDEADSWNIYGDEYIEDARAVLEAAHSIKE